MIARTTAIKRTAVRESSVSWLLVGPIESLPFNPSEHQSTILLRGLRGSLNATRETLVFQPTDVSFVSSLQTQQRERKQSHAVE